ncbi:MAG: acyl carrier protein [Bacteroidales bacterium]|jgi:acyl carrier protein|nr:acyl carrier protein [Bacteroidales bacterium]
MKTQEFIDLIVEELEIEDNVITESTTLDSIEEWDSMAELVIISIADSKFDVKLKSKDISAFKTIHDIMNGIGLDKFE